MLGTIGVSNSEAHEFDTCPEAWLRKYHPESLLAKIGGGPARTRGTEIHKCLEMFYLAIRDGVKFDDARDAACDYIWQKRMSSDVNCITGNAPLASWEVMKMYRRVSEWMARYFEVYRDDVKNWEVISVENFYMLEAEPEDPFYLPMRIDLFIYQRSGMYAGELSPVDHKSTNDWWTYVMLKLNSQMPLYMKALRECRGVLPKHVQNAPINRAVMNFIRTREVNDPADGDLFQRRFVPFTDEEVEFAYQNHRKKARRIQRLKAMSFADAEAECSMVMQTNVCRWCDYKEICLPKMQGQDLEMTISGGYERNTYGYPALEMIDDGN